jgi:hypothetical protein
VEFRLPDTLNINLCDLQLTDLSPVDIAANHLTIQPNLHRPQVARELYDHLSQSVLCLRLTLHHSIDPHQHTRHVSLTQGHNSSTAHTTAQAKITAQIIALLTLSCLSPVYTVASSKKFALARSLNALNMPTLRISAFLSHLKISLRSQRTALP